MHPLTLFLGRTTVDALYRLDTLPEENTKVYARQFHLAPGGPAMNAALTHARLGGNTLLASAVGGGPWAALVRSELARQRIPLLDLADDTSYETPLCAVLINTANSSRTVLNPPIQQTILRQLGPWTAEAHALGRQLPAVALTDGFFFPQISPLLQSLRHAAVPLILDAGSFKPGTAELIPLLSVAICSERFNVPPEHGGPLPNPESILDWLIARGVPCAAVTRGPNPILASDHGRRFEIPIAPIAALDTLGAGDVLHGAFSYYFAHQPDFEPALRRASHIATLSCQSLGAQAWPAPLPPSPGDSYPPPASANLAKGS